MTEPTAPNDENRLIAERRAKLTALRTLGQAYPNDFSVSHFAAALHQSYDACDPLELAALAIEVRVAGRMMIKRVMGKASFAKARDASGEIQLYMMRDELPEGVYAAFKTFDIGDIIAAVGTLFITKTGELTVHLRELKMLAKGLRQLPEKWSGLSDTETRYRQRYLDLIVTEETRATFRLRSAMISYIRRYLEAEPRAFLEVETPMMHVIPGGATARPFKTHHHALDMPLYLRVAPELYLKRLVVGGFERVYEINRNFRNEGVSTRHNPEFTMLEFYWAYATYIDLMDLTEDLLRSMALELKGTMQLRYQGEEIDLAPPFARITATDAVLAVNPEISAADARNRDALAAHCARLGIKLSPNDGWGKCLMQIFDRTVEASLRQPTFITQYPTEVSPLSRRNDLDPEVTDRFEFFVTGRELANGFSELNDPEDQAARFAEQMTAKESGDDEAMHYDADYIRALEYGMPPTAGEGIGIDRLVMLYADQPSIRDVLLFPHMKPEVWAHARAGEAGHADSTTSTGER